MDSLLANYGSDDEEEEPQQQPTRAPLSTFLPPPKVQDDRPAEVASRRSSLFASLPRPRLASEDACKSHSTDAEFENERKERKVINATSIAGRKDGAWYREIEAESTVGTASDGLLYIGSDARTAATASFSDGVNGTPSGRISLFRALPPPKNAGSLLVPLPSQGPCGPSSKRVVELRPTINMAILQEPDDDDDDDEAMPPVKRSATEDTKLTGLAAILPKPKHLGSALGSGVASGRQATLDVGTPVPSAVESTHESGYAAGYKKATLDVGDSGSFSPSRTEAFSSLASLPHSMNESSSMSNQHAAESWSNYADYCESDRSTLGSWEGHNVGTKLPEASILNETSAPYLSVAEQEGVEAQYAEDYYPAPDAYSQGMVAHEFSAQDALAEVLMREKRKGGRSAPVNIVEVKQADLTSTKVREDQLRTTGIAFGPAYKPMSTSKGKPSKLHRRKHQIGSLYFDMKQKEAELTERRAKGYMTKAETQAKYGW